MRHNIVAANHVAFPGGGISILRYYVMSCIWKWK